jgi:mono/diheme cytochrome c family protein
VIERFARARAPLAGALAALALVACANESGHMATASTHADLTATTTNGGIGDADDGRTIFATNCGTCHGATGEEGGVGPSLRGEYERKNYDQTIVWIKHPDPPMPALYPEFLSETEVDDVAAYVQKL